ncbi:hypothetical protein CVT26_013775 [Gymnopilus dilepis]|uniref:F-box domain-containing protein n=1 Tax=Gymnopilus dilepis TaxID=231916 RepID=A0A409Y6M6_9AGAR|nr:hypothetical protein CVT26_013775 [Gymnopilus dilepis]
MSCQSISEISIELQTIILKYLCAAYRPVERKQDQQAPESFFRRKTHESDSRLPEDVCSTSLFPYNVALVCRLWRDILIKIPEVWTRLVFDVAQSPALFIDSFLWSKDLTNLEVVVFNSTSSASIPSKVQERKHVLAIQQAFLPHIARCKSIAYNLLFSSSLPALDEFLRKPMPYLKELRLDCQQDDLDPMVMLWNVGKRPTLSLSLPKLEMLSLTGISFMDTIRHAGAQWTTQVQVGNTATFRISNFKFAEEGHYSFDTFLDYISQVSVKYPVLHLHNLSLAFPHRESISHFREYRFGSGLHFHSVSMDFLSRFDLLCINEVALEALTFENCQVPIIYNFSVLGDLVLDSICDSDNGASIRNAINCGGIKVWASNCPSFDESTLRWLSTPDLTDAPSYIVEEEYTPNSKYCPAPALKHLWIENCGPISPSAVDNFLHMRPDCHISVKGQNLPRLNEDDKSLLR